jgi:branched-subunit amino acid transport protein
MSAVEIWVMIIGLTLVTLATRNFFIVLGDAVQLPARVQHALRYAPACALTALIAPEVLTQHGAWAVELTNPKLNGALIAIVVMLMTRNTLATMALGMGAFLLVRVFV